MTAFFSCQFTDYTFSVTLYWKWFGGIFAASLVGITLFTVISGTSEGKIITKPLSRQLLDFGGDFISARRKRKILGRDE